MADRGRHTSEILDPPAQAVPTVAARDSSGAQHRWRLLALLVGGCAVGAAAVLPYSLALLSEGQIRASARLPVLVAAS
jgi:hypothetical protein